MIKEAMSPAVDPNKKIRIPKPLSYILNLQKTTSFKAYPKLPTIQMMRASAGPTLPSKGNIMANIEMAHATACPNVKYWRLPLKPWAL